MDNTFLESLKGLAETYNKTMNAMVRSIVKSNDRFRFLAESPYIL